MWGSHTTTTAQSLLPDDGSLGRRSNMRSRAPISVAHLMIVFACAVLLTRSSLATSEADVMSLAAAMAQFNTEFQNPDADIAKIAGLLSDNYVHTNGETGEVWDKAAWLKFAEARRLDLKSGRWRLDTYGVSDQVIHWLGCCTAVVTFVLKSSGVRLERPYAYQHRITQVWSREGGHWLRAAYHDSSLSPAIGKVDIYAPEREVLAFEKARREAVLRADIKSLDSMTAPDLVYVDAHGFERNKQQYLEHIRTENIHYNSYALEDTTAKIYGDLAVATGLFKFDVTVEGKRNTGAQYYTGVYVRNEGEWTLLIWHPTYVASN
jgi:ketosteroid isomerase-like protein